MLVRSNHSTFSVENLSKGKGKPKIYVSSAHVDDTNEPGKMMKYTSKDQPIKIRISSMGRAYLSRAKSSTAGVAKVRLTYESGDGIWIEGNGSLEEDEEKIIDFEEGDNRELKITSDVHY